MDYLSWRRLWRLQLIIASWLWLRERLWLRSHFNFLILRFWWSCKIDLLIREHIVSCRIISINLIKGWSRILFFPLNNLRLHIVLLIPDRFSGFINSSSFSGSIVPLNTFLNLLTLNKIWVIQNVIWMQSFKSIIIVILFLLEHLIKISFGFTHGFYLSLTH